MELASLFIAMFKPLLWLLPLLILAGILQGTWFKGWLGEQTVRRLIARRLDPEVYREFSDVTILDKGGTTQIDHIYVSPFGIFVIETKNMRGWIFGRRNESHWTQTIYRNKSRFQNPLRQNYRHIKALESLLGLPFDSFKSVIVFTGDCTFKTEMPDEVCTCSDLIEYMRSIDAPILSKTQVAEACERIRSARLERSYRTHREHVDGLKRRHGAVAMHGPDVGPAAPVLQNTEPSADVRPWKVPRKGVWRASNWGRDRDWGPLIFGAAVLLVVMVSCVRSTTERRESARAPARQAAPVRTEPVTRPAPVVSPRPKQSQPVTARAEMPTPRKQTPEEVREAKRRADAAMEVIKATTPEM